MKILFLLTQDLESPSGLGRYFPIAKELVVLGHDVEIAALHSTYRKTEVRDFVLSGVRIRYVAQMHVRKHGNKKEYHGPISLLWHMFIATVKLSLVALSTDADIIHIAKPHPMNSIAGLLAKILRRKTLYLDCDDYEAESNRLQNKFQQFVVRVFEDRVPFFVDKITTNTFFTHDRLVGLGVSQKKLIYLSNGVDLSRFTLPHHETLDNLRKTLDLKSKFVISFIGSLSLPSHPVNLLIDAFKDVHQTMPNTVLLLVGGGEDIPQLRQQVAANGLTEFVIFVGRVAPDDVVHYYYLSDALVDPVYDNATARGRSPLKIFESWACGVPVITGDVGERRLLMGVPPAGVLVRPDDMAELAAGIVRLLRDHDLRRTLIDAGHKNANNYAWERLVQKWHDEMFDT